MKLADRFVAGFFILFSAFMIYQTTLLKQLAYQVLSNRLFPYMTFGLLILLAAILFATTLFQREEALPKEYWIASVGRRRMIMLGLFAVYLWAIPLVGFLEATGVFVVVASTWLSPNRRRDGWISILVAGGTVGLIYVVFVYWLYAFLP